MRLVAQHLTLQYKLEEKLHIVEETIAAREKN